MDLLGSILDSMEKPPKTSTKQDMIMKKQQETQKKLLEQEKNQMKKFRLQIEEKIVAFNNNDEQQNLKFDSMDKIYRTIIHDIADKHELVAFSFGIESIDRHVVVYKKEFKPSDDELDALRKGEVYDRKLKELRDRMESKKSKPSKKDDKFTPTSHYKLKYANITGLDTAEEAAKVAKPNEQFGMVPSSNKRDLRSIEQILNDNKKKRLENSKE